MSNIVNLNHIPTRYLNNMFGFCWGAPVIAHSTGHYAAGTPEPATPQSVDGRVKGKGGSLKRSFVLGSESLQSPRASVPRPSPAPSLQFAPTFVDSSGEVPQDAQSRHDCSLPRSRSGLWDDVLEPLEDDGKGGGDATHSPHTVSGVDPGASSMPESVKGVQEPEEKDALYWKFPSSNKYIIYDWYVED